ncbi:MAG: hypothetical protein JXP39_10110 [Spirochaetales bacterium]|nr:hypothetical protein [Spirochaetales bacterium]
MENFNSEYISHFDGIFFARVFMEMPCGAAYLQLLFDDAGNPIDYVTLEVNPYFLRTMHKTREAVIGRKASSRVSPEELKHWISIFQPVAMEGASGSYAMYTNSQQTKFTVLAMSPKIGYFCLFFTEDPEYRKKIEI